MNDLPRVLQHRHPPLASAERLDALFIGSACHAQRRVPVAESVGWGNRDMPRYIKIGRDIIVGKGLTAKHWSGPVIFGREAIYICPNASQVSVMQGLDSGPVAGGVLGAIGGVLAGVARTQGDARPSWKSQLVDLRDLPPDVTNSPDWPVRKSKRPVIVLRRELVEKIERDGGKFLVSSCGDTFKLGMKLFGRSKVVGTVRDLGWQI